jgi:hypothetical protein
VRVPDDVYPGKAIITVSVPAWKDRVTPLKLEVPVVAEKPLPGKAAR